MLSHAVKEMQQIQSIVHIIRIPDFQVQHQYELQNCLFCKAGGFPKLLLQAHINCSECTLCLHTHGQNAGMLSASAEISEPA